MDYYLPAPTTGCCLWSKITSCRVRPPVVLSVNIQSLPDFSSIVNIMGPTQTNDLCWLNVICLCTVGKENTKRISTSGSKMCFKRIGCGESWDFMETQRISIFYSIYFMDSTYFLSSYTILAFCHRCPQAITVVSTDAPVDLQWKHWWNWWFPVVTHQHCIKVWWSV